MGATVKRIQPKAPMLVMRGLVNDSVEIRERAAVQAFVLGYATKEHFDVLTDMQGVMILAGSTSERRRPAMLYARDVIGATLISIKERYARTGKMGCTGDELKVLKAFPSKYRDFWLHQPTELYEAAVTELQNFYNEQARKNATENAPAL